MSLIACSICGERIFGKPASLYWAWRLADGTRRAWKQSLCSQCFVAHYMQYVINAEASTWACPRCQTPTETDYDAIYVDIYMPRQPRHRAEFATCGMCAAQIRAHVQQFSGQLPDRMPADGRPQPPMDSADVAWDELGMRMR